MEHLSMSDFPFPPRKIANVRDLVNVKSHSSYSVILWTKQKLLIGEKWSLKTFLLFRCMASSGKSGPGGPLDF